MHNHRESSHPPGQASHPLDEVYPNPADPQERIDRREFLALASASAALAGVVGCSPRPAPLDEIVPYVRPPEGLEPGASLTFATAMELGGAAVGLLVSSREGRPIKIEGNPDHPGSLGATDLFSQAALLGLYDPDRSGAVIHRGTPSTWEAAMATLRSGLRALESKQGAGLRVLTGAVSSRVLAAQLEDLLREFPRAKWVRHEPAGGSSAVEGARRAFGEPVHAVYDLARADVVLALDADFLASEPGTVRHQHDFAGRRRVRAGGDGIPAAEMNRLYAVESMMTTTGANADHRLPLRSGEIESFARALATALNVAGTRPPGPLPENARAWLGPLAADLLAHRGRSLVLVGQGQPASLHALGHAMNAALDNIGKTVRFIDPIEAHPHDDAASFRALVDEMAAGKVELLLVLESNPVYTTPGDLSVATALGRVPLSAHLGLYRDETGAVCQWHVPAAHFLEAWGDVRGPDGTVTIQQPLIDPLHGGHSAIEFLAALAGAGEPSGREIVRQYWRRARGNPSDFEHFWERAVGAGTVSDTAAPTRSVTLKNDWGGGSEAIPQESDGLELGYRPDPTLYDGRFANNGWLQELPKPVSKLTWGNAAFMGPATARRLGIAMRVQPRGGQHGGLDTEEVELRVRGRSVRAPVFVLPGHAEESVTVHLGHGRQRAGLVGTEVGFNAYLLRSTDAPSFTVGLEVRRTGARATLACTQAHHAMEGRETVRHTTAPEFARDPHVFNAPLETAVEKAAVTALPVLGESIPPQSGADARLTPLSFYPEWPYNDRRWAMVIDQSVCTGCSACVVACQSENNIPVVGKQQVLHGREMHWLRIDTYAEGSQHYAQPVPCMHCEKAPCEVVCPVGATVHSHDGLNDMVYNRCVGTRYCSNNCPYKVRRFNFLEYADFADERLKPLRNPEVTVRSRGVMEKCTYCVQRIRTAEHEAEASDGKVADGRVQTACQQACPSRAIVFGDWNDPASKVRGWKDEPHNYGLLAELNTQPRTTYLAAVRNPNPEMPEGA